MIGKIVGTSLAGLLQFIIWAIIGLALMFAASAFFGVNVGPTAKIPPELMQARNRNFLEQHKCILANYGIYLLPVS